MAQGGGLMKASRERRGEQKLSEFEIVIICPRSIGNCQNLEVSGLESARIGKCQNSKLSELENIRHIPILTLYNCDTFQL